MLYSLRSGGGGGGGGVCVCVSKDSYQVQGLSSFQSIQGIKTIDSGTCISCQPFLMYITWESQDLI